MKKHILIIIFTILGIINTAWANRRLERAFVRIKSEKTPNNKKKVYIRIMMYRKKIKALPYAIDLLHDKNIKLDSEVNYLLINLISNLISCGEKIPLKDIESTIDMMISIDTDLSHLRFADDEKFRIRVETVFDRLKIGVAKYLKKELPEKERQKIIWKILKALKGKNKRSPRLISMIDPIKNKLNKKQRKYYYDLFYTIKDADVLEKMIDFAPSHLIDNKMALFLFRMKLSPNAKASILSEYDFLDEVDKKDYHTYRKRLFEIVLDSKITETSKEIIFKRLEKEVYHSEKELIDFMHFFSNMYDNDHYRFYPLIKRHIEMIKKSNNFELMKLFYSGRYKDMFEEQSDFNAQTERIKSFKKVPKISKIYDLLGDDYAKLELIDLVKRLDDDKELRKYLVQSFMKVEYIDLSIIKLLQMVDRGEDLKELTPKLLDIFKSPSLYIHPTVLTNRKKRGEHESRLKKEVAKALFNLNPEAVDHLLSVIFSEGIQSNRDEMIGNMVLLRHVISNEEKQKQFDKIVRKLLIKNHRQVGPKQLTCKFIKDKICSYVKKVNIETNNDPFRKNTLSFDYNAALKNIKMLALLKAQSICGVPINGSHKRWFKRLKSALYEKNNELLKGEIEQLKRLLENDDLSCKQKEAIHGLIKANKYEGQTPLNSANVYWLIYSTNLIKTVIDGPNLNRETKKEYQKILLELEDTLATIVGEYRDLTHGQGGSLVQNHATFSACLALGKDKISDELLATFRGKFIKDKNTSYLMLPYFFDAKDRYTGMRESAARTPLGHLTFFLNAKNDQEKIKYIKDLIFSLKIYRNHMPYFMMHANRSGGMPHDSITKDRLGVHYFYPTIPYVTAALKVLQKERLLTDQQKRELKDIGDDILNLFLVMINKDGSFKSSKKEMGLLTTGFPSAHGLLALLPLMKNCDGKKFESSGILIKRYLNQEK